MGRAPGPVPSWPEHCDRSAPGVGERRPAVPLRFPSEESPCRIPPQTSAAEGPALHAPPELTADAWRRAERRLLAKMLGEFAYEEIIEPHPLTPPGPGGATYALPLGGPGEAELRFRARRWAYGHWQVEAESVTLAEGGARRGRSVIRWTSWCGPGRCWGSTATRSATSCANSPAPSPPTPASTRPR
ncbi:hypothetical protein ACFQVA_32560 [Actinomadura keratinilytica]